MKKNYLAIKEVLRRAEQAGLPISRRTFDRYVEKGEIRVIKLDGKIAIDEAELERFLKARTTAPTYKPKVKKAKVRLPDFLSRSVPYFDYVKNEWVEFKPQRKR